MNTTIKISTMYNCDFHSHSFYNHIINPMWRHNMLGCYIIRLIVEMYKFNVSYVTDVMPMSINNTIDVYALPMPISQQVLDVAKPMQPILLWRLGFVVRHPQDDSVYLKYYSKPFSRPAWNCMYGIAFFAALLFYLLNWWEKRIKKTTWECSFGSEILLVIGGYCQHIFPVEAISDSRRIAYFTFFLYSYIIYTFYTSNLLSHLVNDKENDIELNNLYSSDYNIVVLETMKEIFYDNYTCYLRHHNMYIMPPKLKNPRFVNITMALQDVLYTKTAFLSDYSSIYPLLTKTLSNEQICQLNEIDLSSELRLYLLSSNNFDFREQFVTGTLRIKEAGLLKRITAFDTRRPLKCEVALLKVGITQILSPFLILTGVYVIATIVLFVERWHYKKNNLWPYIE